MHPTFATCNNGARHPSPTFVTVGIHRCQRAPTLTIEKRFAAVSPPTQPSVFLSFRIAYYYDDCDDTIWYFYCCRVILLTAAHRWFVEFDFSNLLSLSLFCFISIHDGVDRRMQTRDRDYWFFDRSPWGTGRLLYIYINAAVSADGDEKTFSIIII